MPKVECVCIDNKNKPKEISANKWLVEGNKYTVIYTVVVLPQRQLAFHLEEIELTEKELPYEYFLANRFAFTQDNLDKLMKLIEDCNNTSFSINELLKQTELQEI